jgi:glycosyltransferase involved in cell wall biosynthesis
MASVEVTIPVLNEEQALPGSIAKLHAFLTSHLSGHRWRITIADNGSTDGTLEIAVALAQAYPGQVGYFHLGQRGRGRALRKAWLESDCDVSAYMDVDLSTGLEAFPLLVQAIAEQGYHLAVGSRLSRDAKTVRSPKREFISRAYNLMVKAAFQTRFTDAQCGFKAISRKAAQVLVPVVVNNHWFFDSELLIIAEKRGFRIKEVPVQWTEDPDSRVKIVRTALEDIRGLARLRFGGLPRVSPPTT